MILLKIDGKRVQVPKDTTILQAAAKAGIEIPHLCTIEGIKPYGACRLCTVEISQHGRTRLQAACSYPVEAGIEVRTDTPRVLRGRRIILEFLLARCPDVKEIKRYARRFGVRKTRFEIRDKDDCILCGLCVRACSEVIGAEAIGFSGRGIGRNVDVPFGQHPESCIGCGLCTYVCPTGCMQMEAKKAPKLRHKVGTERTCRYMLMGMVSVKTCPLNIQCWQCPYDQSMEFISGTHPALHIRPAKAAATVEVGPFTLNPHRSYARNHTWVLGSKKSPVVIGVDHFLSSLVGPVDDVNAINGKLHLSSGKRTLTLSLPVEGEVFKVNPDIRAVPRLVNLSPYQRGWIAIVMSTGTGYDTLMTGQNATDWFREEMYRLTKLTGMTGDKLNESSISQKWESLKKSFFEKTTKTSP